MPESKGIISKAFGALFVIAIVMWIANSPHEAAQFATNAIALFQRIIVGILQCLNDISSSS